MLFASPLVSQHNHQQHRRYPQPQQQQEDWSAVTSKPSVFPSPPLSQYNDLTTANHNLYALGTDQPLFEFNPQHYTPSPSLMPSDQSNGGWLSTGQLTPTSSSRAHHRESSLSSLGSVGPASPYAGNTSNPQVAGDLYHDFQGMTGPYITQDNSSKPLTPEHTPIQEQFLSPHYAYYNANTQPSHDGLTRVVGDADLMPTRGVASGDSSSPSTPPSYANGERRKNGESFSSVDTWLNDYLPLYDDSAYRGSMPKLERTMTDVYRDELYNPSFQITTAPAAHTPALTATMAPQNDVFTQRLQAASSQHLSANTQNPLTIPSRERSPFRQGSPLAPSGNGFGARQSPNVRFGTATHMREQQKAEHDARALQQQLERASPEHAAPKTISPKDVDLVYHESEGDANMPLFPSQPRQSPSTYRPRQTQEAAELDDTASQQSYASMATSRRESSAYSASSHATQPPQAQFNFAPPAVAGSVRHIPQQYPFVTQSHRKPSDVSIHAEDFPATLASMESSSSEYAPVAADKKKRPAAAAAAAATADSGTYTCTYHGCTLRFETPAKLQRHKREGHRSTGAWITAAGDTGGMTSAALRNTQEGPHKCERINPSTGKPCNTVFSRPYDLTRHEDTIHNARKQKVRCHLCTEEKSFSRNDALTRHFRVCHPDHVDFSKSRRRGGRDR
jgi:26S proteasome regulatory subunit N4